MDYQQQQQQQRQYQTGYRSIPQQQMPVETYYYEQPPAAYYYPQQPQETQSIPVKGSKMRDYFKTVKESRSPDGKFVEKFVQKNRVSYT
jgi:hypothetical protein